MAGEIAAILGERAATGRQLALRNDVLESVLEGMADAVVVADAAGRVTLVNGAARTAFPFAACAV